MRPVGGVVGPLGKALIMFWALVRGPAGKHPVRRAADVSPGMAMELEFADGRVQVHEGQGGGRPRAAHKSGQGPGGQGTLF